MVREFLSGLIQELDPGEFLEKKNSWWNPIESSWRIFGKNSWRIPTRNSWKNPRKNSWKISRKEGTFDEFAQEIPRGFS